MDSILAKALDCPVSVRFSKLERFERLMNSDEMGFCKSSRAGKSNRFEPPYRGSIPAAPATDTSAKEGFPRVAMMGRESRHFIPICIQCAGRLV
jgi:hypothetical protein